MAQIHPRQTFAIYIKLRPGRAASSKTSLPPVIRASSSSNSLEIEVRQVHISSTKNMNGQNASPLRQPKLHNTLRDIPVMPLPPRNRICRIKRGRDRQGSGSSLSIYID